MITKQQVLINSNSEYGYMVECIGRALYRRNTELNRFGKIRIEIGVSAFYEYYDRLKADFELAGWKVDSYRGSDGLYFVEFS